MSPGPTARLLLFLLAVAAPGARAAGIASHVTRLAVGPDGSGRATCTVVATGAPSETLAIPLPAGGWANLRLSGGPEGLLLDPPAPGAAAVRVTLPPEAAATTTFTLAWDVPEALARAENPAAGEKLTIPRGSRTLRVAFVNTQAATIGEFETLVVLPPGWRVHAIREQFPRPKRSEVEPRVRLGADGGLQNALLQLDAMKQGDSTSMQLEVGPDGPSPLWIVAGVALSALYLVKFRDLVARPKE
ncbi:MAG TPA: hypothetical protein PK598_08610 [Thermoanaerobaculia bacterium]|nr:hypothetical protein [Thermoanaerobaculia bacterium]